MPTANNASGLPREDEVVSLLIGGQVHSTWESYEIDSDLIIAADAWQMRMGSTDGKLPSSVVAGAPVQVKIGNDLVMTGRVDTIEQGIVKGQRQYQLCGRDSAAQLVDCSAPIFVRKFSTLPEIVAAIVRPLGITKIRIDAQSTSTREKINVEPGDTAWEVLRNSAEANGLWPWFEPDGTLVVGGPDYTSEPVAVLTANTDICNVESIRRLDSIANRYSDITVLGQTHSTKRESGKHAMKGVARDTGITWPRPKIIVDHETDTTQLCIDRANKLMGDSRLKGFGISIMVKGHRIDAPGEPGDGLLWTPGQRVRVVCDYLNLNGVYFLMSRRFSRNRHDGTHTDLLLKEDGVWVVDAHPHKRKHRRGKNSLPGKVVDASNKDSK